MMPEELHNVELDLDLEATEPGNSFELDLESGLTPLHKLRRY